MNLASISNGLFGRELLLRDGVLMSGEPGEEGNELHTSSAFSEKWTTLEQEQEDSEGWKQFQFRWYLECYGYASEEELAAFLADKRVILDAGCGPGYKAAWFARLNPDATVIAMDLSDGIFEAARRYGHEPNMIFIKGDIAETPFRDGVLDFISCDQVLHHTESPPETLKEFKRILRSPGFLNTYVYAKKGLPRELMDDHFREYSKQLTKDEIWALSDQLTGFGKTLSELSVEIDVPDMPALNIKGGRYDLQRFIYWNFIKCFWNPEHGHAASTMINYDWYSPSTAFRYSREEFVGMVEEVGFQADWVHSEEACHTGRFTC